GDDGGAVRPLRSLWREGVQAEARKDGGAAPRFRRQAADAADQPRRGRNPLPRRRVGSVPPRRLRRAARDAGEFGRSAEGEGNQLAADDPLPAALARVRGGEAAAMPATARDL